MINVNGTITDNNELKQLSLNRGLLYGDGVFETIKVINGTILFWEDHYLRLMSAMRIMRMDIPNSFTMEFLEEEIIKTISSNFLVDEVCARVRITVYRNAGGFYTPENQSVSYVISALELDSAMYLYNDKMYEVDLFKDHYVLSGLLSSIKSTSKIVSVLAGIFAKENDLQNCLLLNEQKNVIEAANGNLFVVVGNTIKTPPLNQGCLNGIMRKQLLAILSKLPDYEVVEAAISPFELQKANELFITNVIQGIQPITKYRKKSYENLVSKRLIGVLNAQIRLS